MQLTHKAYVKEAKAHLEKWSAEVAKLRAEAKKAKAETKLRYHHGMDKVRATVAHARSRV